MIKTYTYVNDLGTLNKLMVYPLDNGKHPVRLWCVKNGELTGTGRLTPQELKNWLAHYNVIVEKI